MLATSKLQYEFEGDTLVATPSYPVHSDNDLSRCEWDEMFRLLHLPHVRNLILDLQRLTDVTPETIVTMKRLSEVVAGKKGTLSLCQVSMAARRILRFVHMESRWPIFPTREAVYDKAGHKV